VDKREIDALVAVNVEGWRWVKTTLVSGKEPLAAIAPPEAPGRHFAGWVLQSLPATAEDERAEDWDTAVAWWDLEDTKGWRGGLPHYSTDRHVAWGLIERARNHQGPYTARALLLALMERAHFSGSRDRIDPFWWFLYQCEPLDIALAALKAAGVDTDALEGTPAHPPTP
jgi:hypothetical protein